MEAAETHVCVKHCVELLAVSILFYFQAESNGAAALQKNMPLFQGLLMRVCLRIFFFFIEKKEAMELI